MAMLISEILDATTLNKVKSNFHPDMMQDPETAQVAKVLVKAIKSVELYPEHKALIDRFELLREKKAAIYGHRSFYIWQFCQAGLQLMSLKLSDADFLQSNLLKCEISFLGILLDDVTDLVRDKTILDRCVLALNGDIRDFQDNNTELYELISDIQHTIQSAIELAPNYELLKYLLDEAYKTWIDSLEYCLWLDETPRLEEKWERRLEIISRTSLLYLVGLIDLLFVPDLSPNQISSAAQVFLRTEKMVQLSNWITTWKRELAQRDFSSGVLSVAVDNGWITWDDLKNESIEKVTEKIEKSPAESYLWNEWERLRVESHQIVQKTHLDALEGYVEGFSAIAFLELAHKGLH